jgi:uncharacterized protein (TIGR00255 family)
VNGKGLDLRLRMPPGFERPWRPMCGKRGGEAFSRGNVQASLSVQASAGKVEAVINDAALDAVMALRERLGDRIDPAPLKLDTLLSIRGVVDFKEEDEGEGAVDALDHAVLEGLDKASASMKAMREREGEALRTVLGGQIDVIESLALVVELDPSRSPDQIRARLEAQIAALLESPQGFDRERLYAEVALMATKADLREEIDRLKAHVAAARELFAEGGPCRPQARLSRTGIQSRIEYDLFQVERRCSNGCRYRIEGRHRPIQRTGPESGVGWPSRRHIQIERRGLMLVISSPSGAGKSTIARNLLEADPGLSRCRSA